MNRSLTLVKGRVSRSASLLTLLALTGVGLVVGARSEGRDLAAGGDVAVIEKAAAASEEGKAGDDERAGGQRAAMNFFDIGYSGVRAAEFARGLEWLNTPEPLSLAGLRGKIVLLDFWTYGCINCLHVIPELKKLEAKYPDELVVIGVHSAKFDTEGQTHAVRNAALRYGIDHPIVIDSQMRVWDEYAVRAWPTLVLIDPAGRLVTSLAGEGHGPRLDEMIGALAREFEARGQLDRSPLKLAPESARVAASPLFFPGKVAAFEGRVAIADSSHHRVVLRGRDVRIERIWGDGTPGLRDGAGEQARFNRPHGLWFDADGLFVADTANHALRRLDPVTGRVQTLAGTGRQASWPPRGGAGREVALSSPWDLLRVGDRLFVAMAGPHQIWTYDLRTRRAEIWAGTGAESRLDGPRQSAHFAQPSGLASDGKTLWVADAESNCIRAIDLASGRVSTLAGGDLFDFGDRDGPGDKARFRHPQALLFDSGRLLVADTYNGKIKSIDPVSGRVATLLGGLAPFHEPGGLARDGDALLIADTNNHRIVSLPLLQLQKSAPSSRVLELAGLQAPATRRGAEAVSPGATPNDVPVLVLAPGTTARVRVEIELPAGYSLNEAAPQRFEARVEGAGLRVLEPVRRGQAVTLPLEIEVRADATGQAPSGRGRIDLEASLSYCNTRTKSSGVCLFGAWQGALEFRVEQGAGPANTPIVLRGALPAA